MTPGRRAAPLLALCLSLACTANTTGPRPGPSEATPGGTIEDLRAAMASWRRTEATITYRTERRRPGLPMSAHQCLRGFVDEREDIPVALELCDPAGVVRLSSAGPRRWRIDVDEGGTTMRASVDGRRGSVCIEGDQCRSRAPAAILRSFPFHELIAPVDRTLAAAGIDPAGAVTIDRRTVGDVPVECFEVASPNSSARWCFGADGVLRSLRLEVEGRGPTIAEAERRSSALGAGA